MNRNENLDILNINNVLYKTKLSVKFKNRKPYQTGNPHNIMSFIPGTVVDILVKAGQAVKTGDDLIILDAMKMQNILKCKIKGKIKEISVRKGDKVSKGTILIELE